MPVLVLGGAAATGVLASRSDAPPPTVLSAEPSARTIRVSVASDVRLVLVDGQLHEERPLELEVADGETVQVVLVGPDGEEEHRVGIDDDGSELALAESVEEPTIEATPSSSRRSRSRMRQTRRTMRAAPVVATEMTEMREDSMREDSMRVDGRGTGLLDVEL